jgi:hypothetical protein
LSFVATAYTVCMKQRYSKKQRSIVIQPAMVLPSLSIKPNNAVA